MVKQIKYIPNQFDVATKHNYKKAVGLSSFHRAQLILKAEVSDIWRPRLDLYQPLDEALQLDYAAWIASGGKQEGDTLNLQQLFKNSIIKVDDWDRKTQDFYNKLTPRYKEIWYNGHAPFSNGKIVTRISAYKTLADTIGSDESLSAIKAEVLATWTNLTNARTSQSKAKGGKSSGSSKVKTSVEAAMTMQYRNVGWVMDNFYETRMELCNTIFDLELLRSTDQRKFTGTLDELENEAVLIHTFATSEKIKAKSNGNAAYKLYLASSPNGIDSSPILVEANKSIEIAISSFGSLDLGLHRYLTAINQSETDKTQYIIEI